MLNRNLASSKSNVDAFLLCAFLGAFGFHRFYVGKYFTAFIQFFTFGGFLIWYLIDAIAILREDFTDNNNLLLKWDRDREGQYAGFKIRLVAHIIDTIIITSACFLVFAIIIAPMNLYISNSFIFLLIELEEFIRIAMSVFYYVILTASIKQATIGKNIVGIIVVNKNKKALTLGHSFARCLAYYFSYITLGLGFIMIAFTRKHRGLHDIIAKTYVIYERR